MPHARLNYCCPTTSIKWLEFKLLFLILVALCSLPNMDRVHGQSSTPSISGRVTDISGVGISEVTITVRINFRGEIQSVTTQTDANGDYSFRNLPGGDDYRVTPTKPGFIFNPTFIGLSGGLVSGGRTVNFFGGTTTYTISGQVRDVNGNPFGDVQVALSGARQGDLGRLYTDSNGNFSFPRLLANDDYTLTPSKPDLLNVSFNPRSRTVTRLSADQTNITFASTTPLPPASLLQFNSPVVTAIEGSLERATITVLRTGDLSTTATVNYATSDASELARCDTVTGQASERCDYMTAFGTLRFAPGEASHSFTVSVIDDAFVEGLERLTVTLSNPTGAGLSSFPTLMVQIQDNDFSVSTTNPLDRSAFFVRQQYLDFLSREPDDAGRAAWEAVLNGCPNVNNDPNCDRVTVSSSFFRSLEFLQFKGYFVYRFYAVSFGRRPTYAEIIPDMVRVTGQTTEDTLARQNAFADNFVERPSFKDSYSGLSNAAYVDRLLQTAGIQLSQRNSLVADLEAGRKTRAAVLREIVDSPEVNAKEFNRAFVTMQYVGYLRRDPDEDGFQAWLQVLNNNPQDFRTMVNGFMNSTEYRLRFGRP